MVAHEPGHKLSLERLTEHLPAWLIDQATVTLPTQEEWRSAYQGRCPLCDRMRWECGHADPDIAPKLQTRYRTFFALRGANADPDSRLRAELDTVAIPASATDIERDALTKWITELVNAGVVHPDTADDWRAQLDAGQVAAVDEALSMRGPICDDCGYAPCACDRCDSIAVDALVAETSDHEMAGNVRIVAGTAYVIAARIRSRRKSRAHVPGWIAYQRMLAALDERFA